MSRPYARLTGALVALIAAAVVLRLFAMAWVPVMDTTEARYAEIGRKMLELGDWITPWHDYGVPFWGKPPLSFWLTAVSFKLFGVNEFAARLPHFACMLLVAWMAWRLACMRSRAEGLTTLALLSGASLFFVSAGAVMTDAALVVGTTMAMYGFWLGLGDAHPAARPHRWLVFVGLAIGVLAKGPLALILIGLPLAAFTLITGRVRTAWAAFPWLRGTASVAVLVVPWFIAAEAKTPGFLNYFLVGEHWQRFTTPGWTGDLYGNAHRFPIGTVWVFAVAATLPWSVLLPVAAWIWRSDPDQGSSRGDDRAWTVYLACWSLAPLIFFTAARNIIWTYALPAVPAMALFAAMWLSRRVGPDRAYRLLAGGLVMALLGCLVFGLHLERSDTIAAKSAKALVARWQAESRGEEPLVFVGSRLFSASYYSAGTAKLVPTTAGAAELLGPRRGFVALPHGSAPVGLQARLLGRFGRYDLYMANAAATPTASTPRAIGAPP